MQQKNLTLFSFFIFIVFLTENTQAQSRLKKMKISKFGAVYQTFSGDKNKSFGESNSPGYGGELSLDSGGEYFRYFVKAKIINSEGSQNFLDNMTEVRSNYKLTQIGGELGFSFYPVARKGSGLNLYMWGTGAVGYNLLDLKPVSSIIGTTVTPVTTYSKLKTRDQGYSYGAGGGIGFEILFGRKSTISAVYGEAGFREQFAQLAGRTDFQLNSVQFVLGVGF